MSNSKSKTPFKKGFWKINSKGEPKLIGSRCRFCHELFFPKKINRICMHCQQKKLEDVELGPWGKIISFTVAMQQPAGGFYRGPVPYAYGLVDLDEELRIQTQFAGDFEKLRLGMTVKLVIETLHEDAEGSEIQIFRFQLID